MKHFDLNIDKILDNWELSHAIRELIANAIDESVLTGTPPPQIQMDEAGWWRIRDFGRGLRYQDLIQSENPQKLSNPSVIGKFGIGLKDALATFDRKGVSVLIRSSFGDISLSRTSKHSFDDIVTLHATVSAATFPDMVGTECCFHGVSDSDVEDAKRMFLCFTQVELVEETKFGTVYERATTGGIIYINGMKVADEPNFLFSYNITSINAAIKRALNRERQNLGRSAYADRVRAILLASQSEVLAQALMDDLQVYSSGSSHDELSWLDVQEHAVRLLSASKRVLFISSTQLVALPDVVDSACATGFQIVAIPENLTRKIEGAKDIAGNPITEVRQFIKQHNESFQFTWVLPQELTEAERIVWDHLPRILLFVGGLPSNVRDVRISETMRTSSTSSRVTNGLWDPENHWIVISRANLGSIAEFAGTLLHEALHAKFSLSDVSRDFETRLTDLVGSLVAQILNMEVANLPAPSASVACSNLVETGKVLPAHRSS